MNSETYSENGQSLTEFALSLMFLMVLLAGLVDLGRAFFAYMALRGAAQEGASYGAIARESVGDPLPCGDIEDRTRKTTNTPVDLQSSDVEVDIIVNGEQCQEAPEQNACLGSKIRVIVTYPTFPITTPFLGSILGRQAFPISTSMEDTILQPSCH